MRFDTPDPRRSNPHTRQDQIIKIQLARKLGLGLEQARGFQAELTRFAADCTTHPDCPLGTDATTAGPKLADFLASTHAHPLPTGTSRMLDEALAETGVVVTMYDSPRSWPILRKALATALAGNGRELLTLSDLYNERDPKTGHHSNDSEANVAINCLDHPDPAHTVADVQAEVPAYEQASPLTYNGDGHTAYRRGSTCIDAAVDAYLTQGAAPGGGYGLPT
ncbi:MAG: alpha/beta hydrolase [Actinomycetota bacterium]|nr:alpha/beta hydrolase [Actinomycetota bacterium]